MHQGGSGMSSATTQKTRQDSDLSNTDLQRLTLFKWRYSLEAQGFAPSECDGLLFLRWLRVRHPLTFK
jgi:hypothetical protein